MRIRYFGQPWPSPDHRAPICDDDRYQVPIHLVAGKRCLACRKRIVDGDQGVITACSPEIKGYFRLRIAPTEEDVGFTDLPNASGDYPVCAYHIKCFLEETLGIELTKHATEGWE